MQRGMIIYFMFSMYTISHAQFNSDRANMGMVPCTETLYFDNEVEISVKGSKRIISTNAIPEHEVGRFVEGDNTVIINEQEFVYKLPMNPKMSEKYTHLLSGSAFGTGKSSVVFGVAINGVKLNPTSMDAFRNSKTGQLNYFWSKDAFSIHPMGGNDCNSGFVNQEGEYQYQGVPSDLVSKADGQSMFLTGWAADGFPIYYKYGYKDPMDSNSPLIILSTSYKLKEGERSGDGVSEPNGGYDGTYIRDYQFDPKLGDLDKANGRFGVTPDFPGGTYYYVITDEYPSLPRYLVGTVSKQFEVKMVIPEKGSRPETSSEGQRPDKGGQGPGGDPMTDLDSNNDGKLSRSEVKGPLATEFDKLDSNKDGFLSKDEIPERQQQQRPQQRR